MSPSGLHVNKPAVLVIFGLVGGAIIWYKFYSSPTPIPDLKVNPQVQDKSSGSDKVAPVETETVEQKSIKVQNEDVKYRELSATEPKLDVLFLHGQSFSSNDWATKPVLALQLMKSLGYRGVAIDLPVSKKPEEKAKFLGDFISALNLDKPVIVSPSLSGQFSLPYLFQEPSKVLERARGFVPVAPVETDKYVDKYSDAQIPTLIIYGEQDTSLGKTSYDNLQKLPKKTVTVIKDAKHPCYKDKPEEFNKALTDFLKSLLPE